MAYLGIEKRDTSPNGLQRRHRTAYRQQRRIMQMWNNTVPTLTGKRRDGFIIESRRRMMVCCKEINRLRALRWPEGEPCGHEAPMVEVFRGEKVAAQADESLDANLVDNVLLRPIAAEGELVDPYEVLNGANYDGPDPNSRLTKTPTQVTGAGLVSTEDCYLRRDMGAGHFTDFASHQFVARHTSGVAGGGFAVYGTATEDDDLLNNTDACYVAPWFKSDGVSWQWYLMHAKSGVFQATDVWTGVADTTYYFTVIRSGSTVACAIYIGSHGGDWQATLTVGDDATPRRYLFAFDGYRSGSGPQAGWVKELDIGEATFSTAPLVGALGGRGILGSGGII